MTEAPTTKDERPPRNGGVLERRTIDQDVEPDDGDEAPVVRWGVMRPVSIGAPTGTYSNRPAFIEHPTLWQVELPQPKARTALVVVTRRRRPTLFGAAGSPSRLELFWSRGTLYEVDLGLHHTCFEIDLPSAVDTFAFRAEVSLEWRVNQAVTVVSDALADVRDALAPVVRHHLCELTRRFEVGEVIAAERAVANAVHTLNPGRIYGLTTMLGIQLSADTGASEYAASRRDLEQKIVIENLKHEHRRLKAAHEQEILRARMDLYRQIIDSGNVDQLALQLAQNPSGVDSIVALMREERHRDRRQVTDFITQLLGSGVVDRWDVEDQVRTALDWLKDSTERTVQTGEAHIPRDRRTAPAHHNGRVVDEDTEKVVVTK
jgi:hypothetical protein